MGGHENVNAMGFPPSSNVSDLCNPFLGSSSTWDHPLASLSQAQSFGGSSVVSQSEFATPSYPVGLESQGMSMSSTSQFVQYMSDSNYADMVPKVPSYGSGDITNTGYVSNYYTIKEAGIERASINEAQTQSRGENSEEGDTASASHGSRRKRGLDCNSMFNPNKSSEEEALKDSSEQDEKKPKLDQNTNADLRGKQSVKQAKDNSHSGEAPKQNFIHVRARRGQATNSHSLAERVRREKISERMRLLQELVPGCNKITGKAVMLDEIINYVQSLQQQVEFLSMKLATVNPELNFDVERVLSKDILQSRIGHGTIGGYGNGIINIGHLFHSGSFQGTMGSTPSTSPHIPPLPQIPVLHMQNATDHELQSLYGNGMGYDSSTALQDMGPNEL